MWTKLLSILAILGGGVSLYWYSQLSDADKAVADFIGEQYAFDLFSKALDQLTYFEAAHVNRLTKWHFS